MKITAFFLAVCSLPFAVAVAEQAGQILPPDSPILTAEPAGLEQTLVELCTKARAEVFPGDLPSIVRRKILRLEREDYLIPPWPTYTVTRPVYIVEVVETAQWYHDSLTYIFVLAPEGTQLTPLLVCVSGQTGGTIWFQLVSANGAAEYAQPYGPPVWVPLKTLVVRDEASRNGVSQERLLLFQFDVGEKRMAKVFDQVIGFTAAGMAYDNFRSTFEFKPREVPGPLDNLVVTTKWVLTSPAGREDVLMRWESVFVWNGQEYEGSIDVPQQAEWHQWISESLKILVDLTQPLGEPPV